MSFKTINLSNWSWLRCCDYTSMVTYPLNRTRLYSHDADVSPWPNRLLKTLASFFGVVCVFKRESGFESSHGAQSLWTEALGMDRSSFTCSV